MKVFVSGIYGSGKTTMAKELAKPGVPYLSFDNLHGYKGAPATSVLSGLPENFVLDAVPFDGHTGDRSSYRSFASYCAGKNDVEVRCCVLDHAAWASRVVGRLDEAQWDLFHRVSMPELDTISPLTYWKNGSEVTKAEAASLVDFKGMVLGFMKRTPSYDWRYQDVPELGVGGYSKTHKTWSAIKSLGVQIKGRSFVDVGCNHSYVLFRMEEEGGVGLVGLDCHCHAVHTARSVAWLKGSSVRVELWDANTDEVPDADCTLVLNVLHHMSDPEGFIKKIRSKEVVFEGNVAQVPLISSRFGVVKQVGSHRKGRVTLLARR